MVVHGVIKLFDVGGVNASNSYVMDADISTTNNGIHTTVKGSLSRYIANGQHAGGVSISYFPTLKFLFILSVSNFFGSAFDDLMFNFKQSFLPVTQYIL